jgi:hypothetical protein
LSRPITGRRIARHVQICGLLPRPFTDRWRPGLTNVSRVAKRISLVLFELLFLVFLALIGFAYLLSEATAAPAPMPPAATLFGVNEA